MLSQVLSAFGEHGINLSSHVSEIRPAGAARSEPPRGAQGNTTRLAGNVSSDDGAASEHDSSDAGLALHHRGHSALVSRALRTRSTDFSVCWAVCSMVCRESWSEGQFSADRRRANKEVLAIRKLSAATWCSELKRSSGSWFLRWSARHGSGSLGPAAATNFCRWWS